MKKLLVFLSLVCLALPGFSQHSRHIVRLKDKGNASFSFSNPLAYLSQRAVDRRLRYAIPIDSLDLPVTPSYVTQIDNIANVTILNKSKWLNSVTVHTTDPTALIAIGNLPFVLSVTPVAARYSMRAAEDDKFWEEEIGPGPGRTNRNTANYFNYGTTSFNEIHLHNGEFLHNIGLRGQGMQIGMLDNGYFNYPNLKAFDSARINGQILGTWDFVNGESNVANDGSHGMMCFSTIAANIPGQFVGKAPKASFWLFKTEDDASEFPIEEHNWVCGVERADSTGSDVISSSLGYYDFDDPSFNYDYSDMNGNTTISSRGADIAARKGLLVFNAAGNEGNNSWHYIITPADGDSVVAVGAVNTSGNVGGFSSYGPSADGQVKPDMASVGVQALVQTTANTVGSSNGTSFACPNMAGLGTCLWQGFPEYNNMKIVRALQVSGNRFANPDDRTGYGIPNMKTAFGILLAEYATSSSTANGCRITIQFTSKDVGAMKYEIERKAPGETNYTKVGELNPVAGELLVPHSYSFPHDLTSGSSGSYSFRIRQIIDTETATFTAVYIDTTNIQIAGACVVTTVPPVDPARETVTLAPNPVDATPLQVIVETPYAVPQLHILVYDEKGSLVLRMADSKLSGKKSIPISVERLAAGKYYVRVLNGEKLVGVAELIRL
jgi:hypothetical protein